MTFLNHYGLIEEPFGVTPDPRFLHLGPQHREAFASLVHETDSNRGFLALIGPPGTGKTSLLFNYLESLRDRARTAYLFQNPRTPRELLRYLLADLGLDAAGKDLPGMHEMLNRLLEGEMRAGRRVVFVIDEAQNLDEKVLESIRLLSNFETPWAKLLHIVLAGQPQLAERLAVPSMAQLRQRISSIARLAPFTKEETLAYIAHRLWVAGYEGPPLFSSAAARLIAEQSGGIARNINNLCFHSMLLSYASGDHQIDTPTVSEAIADLSLGDIPSSPQRQPTPVSSQTSPVFTAISPTTVRELLPIHDFVCRSHRALALSVAVGAAMFLGAVSGATRKTALPHQALDATPSVETAVFPAPVLPPGIIAGVNDRSPSLYVQDHQAPSSESAAPPKVQTNLPERP
jgi:type II secretory pathway predicted ATPase ExeA